MLCRCGDKSHGQSRGEVPLGGGERKCSLRPRTTAQQHSDTVMHPIIHTHTHFSVQMWRRRRLLQLTGCEDEELVLWRCAALRSGGPQFIACSTGTKVTKLPRSCCGEKDVTRLLHQTHRERQKGYSNIPHVSSHQKRDVRGNKINTIFLLCDKKKRTV